MGSLREGWRIQTRVIGALMVRELSTRFGRENIGFLWVMVEPLLFALLVGAIWRVWKGPEEYGINIVAFVVTGYIPLTFFRQSVTRSADSIRINNSLLYHRQIKINDLIFVRFLIEMTGGMMAYTFIGLVFIAVGIFPFPRDVGSFLIGWFLYSYFTFSISLFVAPLAEMSDVVEKFLPVTTYVIVPFSGTFSMMSWLSPAARDVLSYSPPVSGMELMRYGIFGEAVRPYYSVGWAFGLSTLFILFGLILCRRVRRRVIVE